MNTNDIKSIQAAIRERTSVPGVSDEIKNRGTELLGKIVKHRMEEKPIPPGLFQQIEQFLAGEDTSTPSPIAEDLWQGEFDQGMSLYRRQHYKAASEKFSAVMDHAADPALKEEAELYYHLAVADLAERANALVNEAKAYAQNNPQDHNGQRDRWLKIRAEDPTHEEAKQRIAALDELAEEQAISERIDELSTRAEAAFREENLDKVNASLTSLEKFSKKGQSPAYSTKLGEAITHVTEVRDVLRQKLGSISTRAATGDLKGAYRDTREAMNRNLPKLVDAAGLLGDAGAEVPPEKLFNFISERFISALDDLKNQRMGAAENLKSTQPELALEILQNIRAELTDGVLTEDHQRRFNDHVAEIDAAIAQIEKLLKPYRQAQGLIEKAHGQDAETRLGLYRQAQRHFPGYENLDALLASALQEYEPVLRFAIETELTNSIPELKRYQYDQAADRLQEVLLRVADTYGDVQARSELGTLVAKCQREVERIQRQKVQFENLLAALARVEELMKTGKTGDRGSVAQAAKILEAEIPAEFQEHPEYLRLRSLVVHHKDADQNWQQGRDAYRQQKWADAVEPLENVARSSSQHRLEAEELAERARAAVLAEEGRAAEDEQRWGDAIGRYRAALEIFKKAGTDTLAGALEKTIQDALGQLAPLVENDAKARGVIAETKTLLQEAKQRFNQQATKLRHPVSEFSLALDEIHKLDDLRLTISEEAARARIEIQTAWREAYLPAASEMIANETVEYYQAAYALIEELQKANLLFLPEDRALRKQVRQFILTDEYEQAGRASKPDYGSMLQMLRELRQIAPEAQGLDDKIRHTYRLWALHEYERKRRQGDDAEAIAWLRDEMQTPELYQDDQIILDFIKFAWQARHFDAILPLIRSLNMKLPLDLNRRKAEAIQDANQAAQWLDKNNYERAEAQVRSWLEAEQPEDERYATASQLVGDLWVWLKKQRLNELISEAQAQADVFQKALLLAHAHKIASDDPRIQVELRGVNEQLFDSISQRVREIDELKINPSTLDEDVQQMDDDLTNLQAIRDVQPLLEKAVGELPGNLERTLGELRQKLKQAKALADFIKQFSKRKNTRLSKPARIGKLVSQHDAQGGWQVAELREFLSGAERDLPRDRAVRDYIDVVRAELEELENLAEEINALAREFVTNLEAETFDLTQMDRFKKKWRDEGKRAGFSGLESIIYHKYSLAGQAADTFADHQVRIREIQQNIRDWESWKENLTRVCETLEEWLSENLELELDFKSTRELNESLIELDVIGESISVVEIPEVIAQSEELFQQLDVMHKRRPMKILSRKARDIFENRYSQSWHDAVFGSGGVKDNLNRMQRQAKEVMQAPDFKDRFRRLSATIAQLNDQVGDRKANRGKRGLFKKKTTPIPEIVLENVRRELKECEQLDANHHDVRKAQQLLAEADAFNQHNF